MNIEIGQEVVVRGRAGRVTTKRVDGTFDVDFGDTTREAIPADFIELPEPPPAAEPVVESPTVVEADDAPPAPAPASEPEPEPPLHIEPLPAEGEHAGTELAEPAGDQGDGSSPD